MGELLQIHDSEHWWFEDRGPQCTLLVCIDDATSRLMHLRFFPSESTEATRAVLFDGLAHGAAVCVQALTRYIGGHSDLRMGSVTVKDAMRYERIGSVHQ